MRVLLVHNFYQQFGGEDEAALAERKLLEDHGETVIFYSRHNDEIKAYSLAQKALFFPRTVWSRRSVKEIRALVQRERPDVAYVHNVFPLVSPALYHALYSLGVPCVQVLHDFRFLCVNGRFYTQGQVCERCKAGNYLHAIRYRCMRDSYALSSLYALTIASHKASGVFSRIAAYIAPTPFSRQKFVEGGLPEGRIFIKPHMMESSLIQPGWEQGGYVLFLGRLSDEKGVWTLVRAFEQLPELRLKMAGAGPLEAAIQTYLAEKKVGNIELVGFRTGEDKWELLRGALFTVLPSACFETFGKVLLESYAAGKCVVGSRIGAIPYVIEDGQSGLLFEPGNADDLAQKVRFLAARPDECRRLGQHARRLVETRYSPEENYRSLMQVFRFVLDQGAPRPDGGGGLR